jgi:ParB-like nuclease domain
MSSKKFEYDLGTWAPREGEALPSDGDIEKLAIDIRDNGLRHPIVIGLVLETQEHRIIDGMKRVMAYRRLGWSMIDAIITPNHETAMKEFSKANEGRQLSWWESGRVIADLDLIRPQLPRVLGHKVGRRSTVIDATYSRLTGKPAAHIRAVRSAQAAIAAGNPVVQLTLERFYDDLVGVVQLRNDTFGRAGGRDIPSKQAAELIKNVQRTLFTSLDQADRIVDFSAMTDEEIDETQEAFIKVYRKLSLFTRRIRGESISRSRLRNEAEKKKKGTSK